MAEITQEEVRRFLLDIQGREVNLDYLRRELRINPDGDSFGHLRTIMYRLAEQRIVKPSGKKDGVYKVITQVEPVRIFSEQRERRPPFRLFFPRDFDTGMEMEIADLVTIREGDLLLISGVSNYGKTAIALGFCAVNIDSYPVLMGNEYTTPDKEPTPRFLSRLDAMNWVEWADAEGNDRFMLLPVRDDYAEHIVRDRINIIDWINIDANALYTIGYVLDSCKREVGRGVVIAVLQKSEASEAGRGGQFTKDFTDLELLIDKHGKYESRMTIGKVKESESYVTGRSWAFGIPKGVKLTNIREVERCKKCKGKGYNYGGGICDTCQGKKYVDLGVL